jgi:hypothetical protein
MKLRKRFFTAATFGSLALVGLILAAPMPGQGSILPLLCDASGLVCYDNGVYNSTCNTFYFESRGDLNGAGAATDGVGYIASYTDNLAGATTSIGDGITGPTWTYNYAVEIGSDDNTNPTVRSFFTLDDIGGYVAGSAAANSKAVTDDVATVTEQDTGANSACCTSVPDNLSLPNLILDTNTTLTGPEDDDGIAFESTVAPSQLPQGYYTYQSYNNSRMEPTRAAAHFFFPPLFPNRRRCLSWEEPCWRLSCFAAVHRQSSASERVAGQAGVSRPFSRRNA